MTKTTTTWRRSSLIQLLLIGPVVAMPAAVALGGGALRAQAALADAATSPVPSPDEVERLRAEGPAAVALLLAEAPPEGSPERGSWERTLDAVCAQRDCAASGLYWYTDLDLARAEAMRTGKPILSLRLLGRLDEEVSCANSRFFRTVLYPDPKVSRVLRDDFVLHWASVRPVPRLTIDFGDGRTLAGTITGNSIHYVLDPEGRVVDALPGLYGPGLFLSRLRAAGREAKALAAADPRYFGLARAEYHRQRLAAIDRFLSRELGVPELPPVPVVVSDPPTAEEAAVLATSKSAIEIPVVRALSLGTRTAQIGGIDWRALADRHRSDWELSRASRRFLLAKHGAADPAEGQRVLARFEELVGEDTVRNEYVLHAVLHTWLANELSTQTDVDELNERVYADLFLTPDSDPWLGLRTADTYLALAPVSE